VIPPYGYAVDDAVLRTFVAAKKSQRERLLRVFDQLADNPFLEGDTVQLDQEGRPCQVKRFGEWTVIYWSEHLAKRVHIVALEHLRY
jgi:hypothetical protein